MKVLVLSLFVSLSFVSFAQAQDADGPISTAPREDQSALLAEPGTPAPDPAVSAPANPLLPIDFNIEFIVPAQGQTVDSDFQVLPENMRNALRLRRDPAFNFSDDDYNNMRYRVLPSERPAGDGGGLVDRVRGINFDLCDGPWECTFTNRLKLRNGSQQDPTFLPQPGSRRTYRDPASPAFCYPGSDAPKELCRNSVRGVFFRAVRRF
ncbi:MAG: hypothetical protein K0R29_2320 [Pseudobdellovibrio sp.]|jgi:hypothetical protein|nr:hypothetical protein [Pseudobdellovibrio sp.]